MLEFSFHFRHLPISFQFFFFNIGQIIYLSHNLNKPSGDDMTPTPPTVITWLDVRFIDYLHTELYWGKVIISMMPLRRKEKGKNKSYIGRFFMGLRIACRANYDDDDDDEYMHINGFSRLREGLHGGAAAESSGTRGGLREWGWKEGSFIIILFLFSISTLNNFHRLRHARAPSRAGGVMQGDGCRYMYEGRKINYTHRNR